MKQIRNGVFETNSSSVHAMCIATEPRKLVIPHDVVMCFGEYGWSEDTIDYAQEKLEYALTALFHAYDDYDVVCRKLEELENWLEEDGIRYTAFDIYDAVFGKSLFSDGMFWHDCGILDHGSEAKEFVDYIFGSKENMWNFLFSTDSYVMTGNDNSDSVPHINESYKHEEFYKYN